MLSAANVILLTFFSASNLLMDTATLDNILVDPDTAAATQIIDTRSFTDYTAGHIPGAIHLDPTTLAETQDGVAGVLKPVDKLSEILADLGVNPEMQIIIYREMDEAEQVKIATRLYWILEYLSYPHLSILDGGIAKWRVEKRPVQIEVPAPLQTDKASIKAAITPKENIYADAEETLRVSKLYNGVVVDGRSEGEFSGESKKSSIERAGHVPGAKNLPITELVENTGTEESPVYTFLPHEKMAALTKSYQSEMAKDTPIVTYCNSGVSASAAYFGFKLGGYSNVAMYEKSMSEWGNDDTLPIEQSPKSGGKE